MRLFRREATAQRTLLYGPIRPARVATGHHIAAEKRASRLRSLVTRARFHARKEPLVLSCPRKFFPFSGTVANYTPDKFSSINSERSKAGDDEFEASYFIVDPYRVFYTVRISAMTFTA